MLCSGEPKSKISSKMIIFLSKTFMKTIPETALFLLDLALSVVVMR
jgi:hypothetical protein